MAESLLTGPKTSLNGEAERTFQEVQETSWRWVPFGPLERGSGRRGRESPHGIPSLACQEMQDWSEKSSQRPQLPIGSPTCAQAAPAADCCGMVGTLRSSASELGYWPPVAPFAVTV